MTTISTIGVLHPGAMGATVGAAALVGADRVVRWVSTGRSEATRARAAEAGLTEVATLAELVDGADLIISVCPPAAATDVARSVAEAGYQGPYLDANAVAPATVRALASLQPNLIDGGIVGPPAHRAGTTRLFLSGAGAEATAELFAPSVLEPVVVDGPVGAASALKMAYAAWTKGSAALLLDALALARYEGVDDALRTEWERSQPAVAASVDARAAAVGPKAWRFEGEMIEIAEAMAAAGLPDGFHRAAAEVYRRLTDSLGRAAPDATTAADALPRPPHPTTSRPDQ